MARGATGAAWSATAFVSLLACPAWAQTPTDVITYPPAFFAAAAPTTAFDMVTRLPGFAFERGDSVRGLAGSGGNVLIDGKPPVSKNDTLEEILKRIPASSVVRVELIRGGASGIDMGGRSVVANVVRSTRGGFTGAAGLSSYIVYDGRVLPTVQAEGQWRRGERLFEGSLMVGRRPDDMMGDGMRERRGADGTLLRLSDIDGEADTLRTWATAALETPFAGGGLRLNGAYMLNPYNGVLVERSRLTGLTEVETTDEDRVQAELGARHTLDLSADLGLEITAFQQWKDTDTVALYEGPGVVRAFRLDRKTAESVARGRLQWRRSNTLDVEAGAEAALNTLDSRTAFTENGAAVAVPAANVRVEEKRGEVFATATWRPRPGWTVEGGIRQEASDIASEGDVSTGKTLHFTKPRLALTWDRTPVSQIRLRIEREVDQLNFDDFVASSSLINTGVVLAGNPDLRPQQAWVAEAAYERRFWKSGAAIIALRRYELSDVIDRAPVFDADGDVVADAPANIGEGVRDELSASLTLPLDRLGVSGGQLKTAATWRWSQVTDPATGERREISGQVPLDWEVRFKQDLPRWKLTWGVDAFGGFRETDYRLSEKDTRKLSTWVTPFLEYKPRPDLTLTVELESATEGGSKRIREVYDGPRASSPLAYIDRRQLTWGRTLEIRLRKTFGGSN